MDKNTTGGVTHCPKCGTAIRPGELLCSFCGQVLPTTTAAGATRALPLAEETYEVRRTPIGNIPRHFQRVSLIIKDQEVMLPLAGSVIIGRIDADANAAPPDVDLTFFGAADLGVSRQHIELTWKNDLVYVVDMNSTNGTLLNGQRLMFGMMRLLRDGDDLMIGHLPARVKFVG